MSRSRTNNNRGGRWYRVEGTWTYSRARDDRKERKSERWIRVTETTMTTVAGGGSKSSIREASRQSKNLLGL